ICSQEKNRGPKEETVVPCPVVPGDRVYLRVFRRKWNEPRREGPYQVVRATPTAIQVEGSTTWYHLNHCTRAPSSRPRKEEDQIIQKDHPVSVTSKGEIRHDALGGLNDGEGEPTAGSEDGGDGVQSEIIPTASEGGQVPVAENCFDKPGALGEEEKGNALHFQPGEGDDPSSRNELENEEGLDDIHDPDVPVGNPLTNPGSDRHLFYDNLSTINYSDLE
ncbi:hypothetical protein AMELA_G00274370, partial [Ameiurus melas]